MRVAGAVDIGGTTVKIGLVGEDGSILERREIPTSQGGEPGPLANDIVGALRPLIDGQVGTAGSVSAVGVAVAGFLDDMRGSMIENANLTALCGFPLRDALAKKLGLDCTLEVDSNAAVVAELRFGAGQSVGRLMGVTVGTGLGGGVVIDGELLRYTGQCAGDLGHIIVAPDGRRCTCGSRGCLEAMVCAAALSDRAGNRPAREVIDTARDGDRASLDALAETGWWLGVGLAALSPIFAPQMIVVGGGIGTAGDLLLTPTRASYRAHAASGVADRVTIVGSALGGWSGMVGAGSLALDPMP
jgi:glucokinase